MKQKIILIATTVFLFAVYANLFAQEFAGGSGTYDDPFLISTPQHLCNVRNYIGIKHADKHFLLINEIDLDVPPYNEGEGWVPIGYPSSSVDQMTFYGKIYGYMDGKCGGGIIKNLKLGNLPNWSAATIGLFVTLGEGGLIKNVGLENFQVNSYAALVGVLVGSGGYGAGGTIENCYTIGNLKCNAKTVGGIIGVAGGIAIKNCYSIITLENLYDGDIFPMKFLGGISSQITSVSVVTNCYSIGNFTSNVVRPGIIVGHNLMTEPGAAEISNCVAAGNIVSAVSDGRLLCSHSFYAPITLSNNWALNTTTINGNTVTGGTTTNKNGQDTTLAALQSRDFYENVLGWDFDSIWTMPATIHEMTDGFPLFQWQYKKELRVILEDIFMEFDFGDIHIGETEEQTAQIKNIGGLAASLIIPPFNNFDFRFIADNNILKANGVYNYKIRFSPTQYGEFSDTIKIITQPCNVEYTIVVRGRCVPIKYTIRASKHPLTDPTRRNYRIPIFITASLNVSNTVIDSLVVEIDRRIFYPKRVDNGNMKLHFKDTVIKMTFENVTVPELKANEEKVLLTIRGDVLLGKIDSSEIKIDTVKFAEQLSEKPDLIHGFITLDICAEGANRLVWFDYSPEVIVKNNPVTGGILELQCKTIERGSYSLEIVDMLGKSETVREFTVSANSKRIFDFEIPILNFSSGAYFIIMNTPTAKYSTGFVVQ